MKKVIYKYKLSPSSTDVILIPKGARLLDVAQQHDDIFVWAEVPEGEKATDTYLFKVRPTGASYEENLTENFLKTVHYKDGDNYIFVFHIFWSKS